MLVNTLRTCVRGVTTVLTLCVCVCSCVCLLSESAIKHLYRILSTSISFLLSLHVQDFQLTDFSKMTSFRSYSFFHHINSIVITFIVYFSHREEYRSRYYWPYSYLASSTGPSQLFLQKAREGLVSKVT